MQIDTVLYLHRLAKQHAPDFGRSHVALREKATAQKVGDLAGIDAVVLLLGPRRWPAVSADVPPRLLGMAALRNRTLSVDFHRQAFRFEIWNNPTTDPTNALNLFIFNDHRRIPLSHH